MHHAAFHVHNLTEALPRSADARERKRLEKAIKTFKADAQRHGDRLLQLAASDSAARVA